VHILKLPLLLAAACLLPQNGADIRARAWGTFFRQGGPMYYGEYALSFAACTGQKDVVAYLRRHGAQVRFPAGGWFRCIVWGREDVLSVACLQIDTDCNELGNIALHMCVTPRW
jgi:hypothetical protein